MSGPDYVPSGNEKGHPAYDISMILTLHSIEPECARVLELRRSARTGLSARDRLELALQTACSCGAGNHSGERTTMSRERGEHEKRRAAELAGSRSSVS